MFHVLNRNLQQETPKLIYRFPVLRAKQHPNNQGRDLHPSHQADVVRKLRSRTFVQVLMLIS